MKSFMPLWAMLFLVATACTQPAKEQSTPPGKQPETKEKSQKHKPGEKPSHPKLTDQNVVEKLSAYGEKHPETKVRLATSKGEITLRLFEQTPLHRANFVMLVKNGYFNGTIFYRVEKGFVIQGGDSDDPQVHARRGEFGNYTIPAEFKPTLKHKPGALALARDYENNPEKRSAPFDFYILVGKNAPNLDNNHTVFGQVVSGMDVVNQIANVETDDSNWPKKDIYIRAEIVQE